MTSTLLAGIVIGVLLCALADRIRGVRTVRYRVEQDDAVATAKPARRRSPSPAPSLPSLRPRVPTPAAIDDNEKTVVTALVGAGYSRDVAMKSAAACASNERTTVESWTRAALKRALTL